MSDVAIGGYSSSLGVVGYQENLTGSGVNRLTTMSFETVGETQRKLGDFTPDKMGSATRFRNNNFTLTFYDRLGAQRKVKDDTRITTLYPAAATDATVCDKTVIVAYVDGEGWYLQADYSTKKYCLNDYPLEDGDGFKMYAAAGFANGIKLICSGEVSAENIPLSVGSGVNALTGNCTPAPVKLGSLTPNKHGSATRYRNNNFTLTFYDRLGAQRKVKDDAKIVALYPAAATDSAVCDKTVIIAYIDGEGWYLQSDYSSKKYCLNNYEIDPTDGFKMYVAAGFADGITIELPSALTK